MLTEKEKNLIRELKKKWNDTAFFTAIIHYTREYNLLDEVLNYIDKNPESNSDDVFDFTLTKWQEAVAKNNH